MKAVVDTNVFVNAIFHGDKWSREVLNRHMNEEITISMNKECQTELLVIFLIFVAEKFKTDKRQLYRYYGKLTDALWTMERTPCKTRTKYSIDNGDNKFINCAIDSNAEYIVTYNSDHLCGFEEQIKKDHGVNIKVLTPYNFIIEVNKFRFRDTVNSNRIR